MMGITWILSTLYNAVMFLVINVPKFIVWLASHPIKLIGWLMEEMLLVIGTISRGIGKGLGKLTLLTTGEILLVCIIGYLIYRYYVIPMRVKGKQQKGMTTANPMMKSQ